MYSASLSSRLPMPKSHPVRTTGKDGFPHFMLKEIYEQPEALRRLLAGCIDCSARGRVELRDFGLKPSVLRKLSRIPIAASGSSRHAGMAGEFMIERMAG